MHLSSSGLFNRTPGLDCFRDISRLSGRIPPVHVLLLTGPISGPSVSLRAACWDVDGALTPALTGRKLRREADETQTQLMDDMSSQAREPPPPPPPPPLLLEEK
ncbi:unnamed protein product [Pleuronectes platessa]|uniref:Uncharacterized protein n=1 Tax=Pleuronectes platessa TaxID=8262 RepID=A0A9N7V8Q2_PLEPL|nr:unnamed protein product [Pleuronectes platessa]